MRTQHSDYHGYRFPPEIIAYAVWLYRHGEGSTSRKEEGRGVGRRPMLSRHALPQDGSRSEQDKQDL